MTRHEHDMNGIPGWLQALAKARERVTGGEQPHDIGKGWMESAGPPPWEPLPEAAATDLADWWGWVASLPAGGPGHPDHCPILPARETALPFPDARDYARFTRQIAVQVTDDPDVMWKESYVPLTGDPDGAFIVDVAEPDLPVYMWWLETHFDPPEPIGYGVRCLALHMTALLDAGCYHYDSTEQRFTRTRAPLPAGFTEDHPLIRGAGSPRN